MNRECKIRLLSLRACSHGGMGPRVGEVHRLPVAKKSETSHAIFIASGRCGEVSKCFGEMFKRKINHPSQAGYPTFSIHMVKKNSPHLSGLPGLAHLAARLSEVPPPLMRTLSRRKEKLYGAIGYPYLGSATSMSL